MRRTTGTGFIGFGLVLLIVGAVLRYAVEASSEGFDLNAAGLIALWAGVVAIVIGGIMVFLGGRSSTSVREDVVRTPDGGQRRIEEREDFSV